MLLGFWGDFLITYIQETHQLGLDRKLDYVDFSNLHFIA